MTWMAFFLITASAVLHAAWNVLAKKYHMTYPFYAVMCSTAALMWLHVQFWTPVPVLHMPWNFWISVASSVISDAFIYCCGLIMAYRLMDMSTAYPIMRSLPLLLTIAVTALFGMGKALSVTAILGMILVFCGCICVPLKKFSDFNLRNYMNKNMFFVLLAACGTTGYTIFDSLCLQIMTTEVAGMNLSTAVISLSYYSTRGIVLSTALMSTAIIIPRQRKHFKEIWKECRWIPFAAGAFGSLTYVLVLISMNYVNNISYIQVFRQLGLLVGMFAGIILLKEKGNFLKFAGAFLIVCGLILSVIRW